jgi:hypothetical protein
MRTLLGVMLVFAGALAPAYGQTGVGAKYGSRDPFVCKSKKDPAKGTPSPSQIKDYVRCDVQLGEGVHIPGNNLYLLDNVQVEIGKGRPYQVSDMNLRDIDSSQPVYPIRGSYDKYQCGVVSADIHYQRGKNCRIYRHPHATGICYKTTFADWDCMMIDESVSWRDYQEDVPPPK